ncbi:MAG: tRNA-dihydrouridine synthase [Rickettsiales bacterium]|jgi:tRNA-dihydrouridine synthase B|nr:tRNA-dihydrouridine synthase [Rickettsiales bacterium]
MLKPLQLNNLTIGTPVFAAPLAGVTDLPFRKILRELCSDLPIMTEMNSCHSLVKNAKAKRNEDDLSAEGLIGAQIFGANPGVMADGARILESRGAKWIDVNMGCPVPKVATRALAGANLMRDHQLAGKIVAAVRAAVKIPISIKTRIGWDAENLNSADLVRICADNGADFAMIHGRTRAQGYAGSADWAAIAAIKRVSSIPIIANGDIKNADDARRVLEITNCDGVMVGRALLGHPWLLQSIKSPSLAKGWTAQPDGVVDNKKFPFGGTNLPQRGGMVSGAIVDIILRHLSYSLDYYGTQNGIYMFRKHLAWYSGGLPSGADFRRTINGIDDLSTLRLAIEKFFN